MSLSLRRSRSDWETVASAIVLLVGGLVGRCGGGAGIVGGGGNDFGMEVVVVVYGVGLGS